MDILFSRGRIALLALAAILAYIAVHEGGHVLAGIASGRSVAEITILSLTPHVTLHGPASTAAQAFAAMAGSTLVILLWLALILLHRGQPKSVAMQLFSLFAGIELLAWFLSAAVHAYAPQHNDATQFIALSGLNPAIVAFVSAAVAGLCGILFFESEQRSEVVAANRR